jgi:hypothetical protein
MNNTSHPLYTTWGGMHTRCRNPNHDAYRWYGAKGISVCPEWNDFWQFVEDMGDRPDGYTLDRIDSSLGYFPSNCKWSSKEEQSNNQDRTKNAKGYSFNKTAGKYMAAIRVNGKQRTIGYYDCPLMARLAYLDAKKRKDQGLPIK